ncbi:MULTISPECIES: DNA-binding response regulator [Amycolatopsis]|uniref:DNA-binding response regulator n=1 Tax=Amycolatopsis TaxID=1813 RepID=UPI0031F931D4
MDVSVVFGEAELFERAAHLFTAGEPVACAAHDLYAWAVARQVSRPTPVDFPVRKLYRPAVLLDPVQARHVRELARMGAQVRITPSEISETLIFGERAAILAGDRSSGERSYSVVTRPDVVRGVTSLFDAAWRSATDLAVFEARFAEVRPLAPRILDMLASGCKDETAAKTLGLGLRTYRRRVAELMAVLGAESRFQAGVRARDFGLV